MLHVVESWWNGRWGTMASQRVRLRDDDGRWSIEHTGPWGREEITDHAGEAAARTHLAELLGDGQEWRRMDQIGRRQP